MDYSTAYGSTDDYNTESLYFYDDEAEGVIVIPNADRTDTIQIQLDSLPHVKNLMDFLTANRVSLSYWVRLAIFYYKKERYDEFVELLEKCSSDSQSRNEKDRVRALDMLAAYYVQCGNQKRTKEDRRECFEKATFLYAMADRVSRYDQNHLIGRAHFCLLEGKTEQEADIQLDFVLKQLAPNTAIDERLLIPACMGKACIMYLRKDYKASLEYFKKCLHASPNCPAFIRLGIGYCLVKLGKIEKAKIAFERCIELDPENIDAQAALAVLQMTSAQDDSEMRVGIFTLGNLYKKEKDHPLILNHLANHFFIKSELDQNADKSKLLIKAKKLLDHAIQISKNEQILAESNFHLARYYHAQNQIVDAHRHYYQACQFNHPKFVLPFYGYGQTSIIMKDIEKAIDSFEKVLKVQPNNSDTLKVLGALYARSSASEATEKTLAVDRKEKARQYLTKAVEVSPGDYDVSLDLAVLLQRSEFHAALTVYEKVIEGLEKHQIEVPSEIYNNIGVLQFRMKNYEKSRESFLKCRELLCNAHIIDEKIKAEIIIVSFNLARTDEKLDKFAEAERIYNGILKKRPNYTDARLRLACMAFNRDDLATATAFCEQLNEIDSNNPDAWILAGNILSEQKRTGDAQKKYEHVLKMSKTGSNDPLALVAMGNIWLNSLFAETRDREKDQKHRDYALNFYLRALRVNPNNVYAAHGAGCILAQSGEINSAFDVFGQVRENVSDYPDVWLNIANIQLDMSHYQNAAQLYQSYLHRFPASNRFEIYCNIAFSYYKVNQWQNALDFLNRAQIEDPRNLILRFNHAFVSMKLASEKLSTESTKLEEVKYAIEMLKTSEEEFLSISKMEIKEVQPFRYLSRTQCGELSRQCSDLLRQSENYLIRAEKIHIEGVRNQELNEMERLRIIDEQRLAVKKRVEEDAIRLEELTLRRRFFMQQNKDALKAHEVKDEQKPRATSGGGPRKRKRQERRMEDSDGFVNDSDENDKVKRKKSKALARKKDRDFINDSDDDKPSKLSKRRSRATEEDPARFKGKVKSRAIVEDSSSSTSDSDNEVKNVAPKDSSDSEPDSDESPREPAEGDSPSSNADIS